MNLSVLNRVNVKKCDVNEGGMYWEWTTLTTRMHDGSGRSCKSVLDKFPPETGKVVTESVISQLSQGLGITQPAQPSSLISDQEVLWCMEVIGYGLSLPLSEHDTIRDCVHVYCEWLSALHRVPKLSVPRPILDDPDRYARHIIGHLHNLFVPRKGEGADTINRQAVLCHRVLRTLQDLAQVSPTLTRDTWEALLLFLLAINDTLLAPPTVKDDVGDQLCERVLSVLLEVWLVACARCFPAPPLWKTLRELCHNWRHRLALVEQWNRVNLALTARLLRFLYGPPFPDLKISAEDAQLVPADMSPDCIAQSWFRFLHMLGNPAALCNRTVISHTQKFLQLALASDNVTDPCHHPCLNALPQIFLKACRGIAGLVDAFLGIPRSGFVGLTSSRASTVSSHHSTASPTSNTSSSCLQSVGVDLSPSRPKCNSILHLFGEWLFEAALVTHDGAGPYPHSTGPGTPTPSTRPSAPPRAEPAPTKRPSSLLADVSAATSRKGSASLASLTLSEEGDSETRAHEADSYQAGRAEAVGALCRIFCAKKTGEEILPVYLARFYLTLQQGLKVNEDHECSEVLASILLNSPDLFRLDLDGVQVLLPSVINALELVLPEKELKMRSTNVSRTELRRASINLLLSVLVLPLHFQNLPIKELSPNVGAGAGSTEFSAVPFVQLKPRLMNMLISALQFETDAQNTQMLLGGLLLSVQDSAGFEITDQATQPGETVPSDSDSGSNLLSAVSAHALFVRATYLVCHRLISSWKTDLNISLAALELLSGLARVNIREADSLECKRAVKWLCDFIMYQCWRPPQLHSKDLHSTIVAAFNCAAVWLAAHPYLLQDKECLGNVLEVVELGISGSKSVGKPGDAVKTKDQKELKPASMRVRDAAETLLTVILEQAGAFPSPCGPESLSSLLDEEALLRHCARGSTPANAVRRFRYFVLENSILLALLEEPLGNDEDPQPTVTALIRGPFGRHAWAFQLRHLPRHKSGLPHKASLSGCGTSPGRPVPMSEQIQRPTTSQRYFPESVDRIPQCKIDKSIPSLDSLLASEVTANEHARLTHLIEKQASLEQAGIPSVCPRPDKECLPPPVCHDFQTARLFLSHFGFLPLDAVQADASSLQTPCITALDSNRTNFSNDIEALDNIGVRTCDTVHIFYVRSGQKTALEIVDNVHSESSVNPHFLELLLCLGWPVDVLQHPGWTGHVRTSWKTYSNAPPTDNIVVSNHGGSIYDGESKVIYWADVSSEIAFVVPSRRSEEHQDTVHSRWYERSVSDSGSVQRGMSADRTDKNMNLRPNASSWSIANMEKTRAYSLDLDKEANALGGSSTSTSSLTGAGSAPSSSESRRRASPAHNAPTKVLVVWLESFEDHTQLPLRDLLAFTSTGLEGMNMSAAPERDCFVIFLHALQSGLLRVKLQGPSGRMSLATPLVDGMVASRRVLGPLVRQTALNMCRRRRLDNDSYQPPHVRRRLKVQDIVARHRNPMSEPHLLSHLFTSSSP